MSSLVFLLPGGGERRAIAATIATIIAEAIARKQVPVGELRRGPRPTTRGAERGIRCQEEQRATVWRAPSELASVGRAVAKQFACQQVGRARASRGRSTGGLVQLGAASLSLPRGRARERRRRRHQDAID